MFSTVAAAHVLVAGAVLMLAGCSEVWGWATLQVAARSPLSVLLPTGRWLTIAWRLLGLIELVAGLAVLVGSRWGVAFAAIVLTGAAAFSTWAHYAVPGRPCGCFGAASAEPASSRAALRSGALALATVLAAVIGTEWTSLVTDAWFWGLVAAEAGILGYISPEARVVLKPAAAKLRSRYHAQAGASLDTVLSHLFQLQAWRELRDYVVDQRPIEHWREGSWTYVCFHARHQDRAATAVFAVSASEGWAECRGALVNEERREVYRNVAYLSAKGAGAAAAARL
jgi:hypothetical protein